MSGETKSMARVIFSVDVEDWFHILDVAGAPDFASWERQPSRVERNFRELLEIFAERDRRVTCFFLGWVAQRFPHLVREAADLGHEIASHGYAHRLIYTMTEAEFTVDARRTRELLEDIAGEPVQGFRAPGFSVTPETPWFFAALEEAGYRYDSSVFPSTREHGGWSGAECGPHVVAGTGLVEFPISTIGVFGRRLCVFGGGYLRAFPTWFVRRATRSVLGEGRPVIVYIHPREIDPKQPRVQMPLRRRIKCYVNLRTTEKKVRQLTAEFASMTFREYVAENFAEPAREVIAHAASVSAGGAA
ncbi:MAG: XrtA system polysaccharide deacetylase [Terriglobales bacterium]